MSSKYARRHYEDTAEIMRVHMNAARTPREREVIDDIAREFAHLYANDNSRFDSARFANAYRPTR